MIFQRAELHNHTTESDGSLSVRELMHLADEKGYGVLALTDHNTCSGHRLAEQVIKDDGLSTDLIRGVELTTFYGHVLTLGMNDMISFSDLDPNAPEGFFKKLRANGARAIGLAHPFCLGRPVMAGCRFDMKIHDWNVLDYIEVFKTSSGMDEHAEKIIGNENALRLWEDKVLSGFRLAAVTGKDIHRRPADIPCMITYAVLQDDESEKNRADAVIGAILRQRTLVTKGPLMWAGIRDGKLVLSIDNSSDYFGWNRKYTDVSPLLLIRDDRGHEMSHEIDISEKEIGLEIPDGADRFVLRLYDRDAAFRSLLCAGIYVERERSSET